MMEHEENLPLSNPGRWRSREGREEAGLGVWRAAWYSLGTGKLSYMGLVYDMREALSINPAYVCGNLSYLNLTYGMGELYKVSLCVWSGHFDSQNLACGLDMLTARRPGFVLFVRFKCLAFAFCYGSPSRPRTPFSNAAGMLLGNAPVLGIGS